MREFDPTPKIQKSGDVPADTFKTVDEPTEILGAPRRAGEIDVRGKKVEVWRKGRRVSR